MTLEDRLAALRRLAAAEPDDPLTQFLYGSEAAALGFHEEARAAFEKTIRLDPRYTAAYRHLGNALERLDRVAEATDVYRRGIEVARRTRDLQAGKEMEAFLKKIARQGERKSEESGS
jgi:tetratricopeptide (TPR) repeat protein